MAEPICPECGAYIDDVPFDFSCAEHRKQHNKEAAENGDWNGIITADKE